MASFGIRNPKVDEYVQTIGLGKVAIHWNLEPARLIEKTIKLGQGHLNKNGALAIDTGEFTGRSPKDRFIVKDETTTKNVDWGDVNKPISPEHFDRLYQKVIAHLNQQDTIYARDAYACANRSYQLNVRVYSEYPWQNLFVHNMFLRPSDAHIKTVTPDWQIFVAPGLRANPETDGTRQHNFAIINFSKQTIIIGGTAYTGEIKKGIFSVLNYQLPLLEGKSRYVLPMHCSANVGPTGDTALFFGLSGTGKTTLSADPQRKLIGDDEHGWSTASVFNFEGGCYAKCINLSASKEPQIYNAIRFGALLENIVFLQDSRKVDYEDCSKTMNTRVSYPIYHIDNHVYNSRGDLPKNIFFLTCDAFGILPPISRLNTEQTKYHFLSGYTAKIAGTEQGVTEPMATFSACFGHPFLPLHPTKYAEMLGKKIERGNNTADKKIRVWLVNTGWTGGGYGVGSRIALPYTRAMISAALKGRLDDVPYQADPIFGLEFPTKCPDVPNAILNPRETWLNEEEYDAKATELAIQFAENFQRYADKADEATLAAAPKIPILK